MRLTRMLLIRRGWRMFPDETPESYNLIRSGERKWRDYQPKEIEPPYWYKWTTESPYHPSEQQKIKTGESIQWYKNNYDKMKIIEPDKWLYKVGDRVEILVGKDKGKQSEIVKVIPEANFILVGGLNCERSMSNGQLNQVEQPLQHDEVSLLDPKSKKPTNVSFKVDKFGQRVRVSHESGYVIEWPPDMLADWTPKKEYVIGDRDTHYEAACQKTYKPTMDSFEEELSKLFSVKDSPRRKTFWY